MTCRRHAKGAPEAAPSTAHSYQLLLSWIFLGELHLGALELLRHLGYVIIVHFCGHCFAPLVEGPFPVRGRQFQTSSLLIQVTEVVLDGRIRPHMLGGLYQLVFRQLILSQSEVGPSERIE